MLRDESYVRRLKWFDQGRPQYSTTESLSFKQRVELSRRASEKDQIDVSGLGQNMVCSGKTDPPKYR